MASSDDSSTDSSSTSEDSASSKASSFKQKSVEERQQLTVTELIRKRAQNSRSTNGEIKVEKKADSQVDLDEEIRRLEEELQESDDSSSDDEDGGGMGKSVVSMSQSKEARIESLPVSLLPANVKRSSKDASRERKRKRKHIEKTASSQPVSEGLKVAVQEILRGYTPRSAERLPFYCRVCAKQYENETEFLEHRDGAFHKAAAVAERRASFCKLCRKQLTSPAQLKEHLQSRPHKERLQNMKSKQQQHKRKAMSNKQWS